MLAGTVVCAVPIVVERYGIEELNPERLVEAVMLNHTWLYDVVRSGAQLGNRGF